MLYLLLEREYFNLDADRLLDRYRLCLDFRSVFSSFNFILCLRSRFFIDRSLLPLLSLSEFDELLELEDDDSDEERVDESDEDEVDVEDDGDDDLLFSSL